MSATKASREIARVMAAYNYELVRAKRHQVWQHKHTGHRVITSATPSDHRALANITARAIRGNQSLSRRLSVKP